MNERDIPQSYEPPALVEVGEFSEDTLGGGWGDWDSFWLLP